MSFKKIILSVLLLVLLATPVASSAAITRPSGVPDVSNIGVLVQSVANIMWTVFGAMAVIMFVIAGITFMTAQGEPEKLKTARSFFIWGVVGVAVAIIAYSIIKITASFFTTT